MKYALQPRSALFILFVSLSLPADAQPSGIPPDVRFPLQCTRILFLGDSITHSGQYVADIETQVRLQNLYPVPLMVNLGLPSETCTGLSEPDHPFPRPNVHERLERALQKFKPDLVVACYGMNDGIYYPFSEERFQKYQQGIQKLVEQVHAAKARIVLLTPPPFDPVPLKGKEGKLLPDGADKYAWFAVYENYDNVIEKYADFIMKNSVHADMVVDVHTPITEFLKEQRKTDPDFTVSADGVHMNDRGHEVMAKAILKAWGVESWEEPSAELRQLIRRKTNLLHNAWLSHVGHTRPGVKPGLPLEEAELQVKDLQRQIDVLVRKAQQPVSSVRQSTGGTIHRIRFPASLNDGTALKLAVEYFLYIPDGAKTLRGVIVHQHGCGPGASMGGRTAADDLHWQALATKHQCALMGSSYEPRKGVDCRLWCDPRRGSANAFGRALEHLARQTGHRELTIAPWCLWGHSGGGFWASLMQLSYGHKIVAVWLQSGTAFGYWKSGEISAPDKLLFNETTLGVPVLGCPGVKERDHERFRRAWDGLHQMQKEYTAMGAPFFQVAPDPRTGHECGDSRYLAIPYFDFWLTHRLPASGRRLNPVTSSVLNEWSKTMAPKMKEFIETGAVGDNSPPQPPSSVAVQVDPDGTRVITWTAEADFESGIRAFLIERNGRQIAQVPEKPIGRFGRPLFQTMSYHDTPETPLPAMQYRDTEATAPDDVYSVRTVNSVELVSAPTQAASD